MRTGFFLILLLLSCSAYAIGVEEFALYGLIGNSKLVYFTPYISDENNVVVRDKDENVISLKIEKFTDVRDVTVLKHCEWSKQPSLLRCESSENKNKAILYQGVPYKWQESTGKITFPIQAKRIQRAIERQGMCTGADAVFTCGSDCPTRLPKTLMLVYCGD